MPIKWPSYNSPIGPYIENINKYKSDLFIGNQLLLLLRWAFIHLQLKWGNPIPIVWDKLGHCDLLLLAFALVFVYVRVRVVCVYSRFYHYLLVPVYWDTLEWLLCTYWHVHHLEINWFVLFICIFLTLVDVIQGPTVLNLKFWYLLIRFQSELRLSLPLWW